MIITKKNIEATFKRIYKIWLIGGSFITLIFGFQVLLGKYENFVWKGFIWFLPLLFPILLISITRNYQARYSGYDFFDSKDYMLLQSIFWLSLLYLCSILAVFFLMPFTLIPNIKYLQKSSYLLYPLQFILDIVIVYFVNRKPFDRSSLG